MEKREKILWGIYAAMLAAFVVMLLVIPSEPTFVFYTALTGTVLMCVIAGVAGWLKLKHRKAEGHMTAWPDVFTMLAIQLLFFAFLDMGSVFCPKYIAVVAELIVFVPTVVIIFGEERLREAVRWLHMHRKGAALVVLAVLLAIPALRFGVPFVQYKQAQGWLEKGEYARAARRFAELGNGYLDAKMLRKESLYREGLRLNEAGDVQQAYFTLQDIMDYEDVPAYIAGDEALMAVSERYSAYGVGNVVTFGMWNGEPLEWGVLAQDGSRRLMITRENVGRRPFNDFFDITYWETSTLRAWLNADFMDAAFDDAQRARILETEVRNDDNAMYRTEAGDDTVDNVFLLSIDEAEVYRHVCKEWFKGDSAFWLRSPGCSRIDAAHVTMGGGVDEMGINIDKLSDVRPVIWIDIADIDE